MRSTIPVCSYALLTTRVMRSTSASISGAYSTQQERRNITLIENFVKGSLTVGQVGDIVDMRLLIQAQWKAKLGSFVGIYREANNGTLRFEPSRSDITSFKMSDVISFAHTNAVLVAC
jgi:hypothetical protein